MSCACQFLLPGSGNGIRLVEGSGSTGRLEISSTTPWLLTDGETIAWRPVCAVGGLIDNVAAQDGAHMSRVRAVRGLGRFYEAPSSFLYCFSLHPVKRGSGDLGIVPDYQTCCRRCFAWRARDCCWRQRTPQENCASVFGGRTPKAVPKEPDRSERFRGRWRLVRAPFVSVMEVAQLKNRELADQGKRSHDPVGYVYCTPNTGARRLSDNDTASGLASDAGASGDEQVVHERGTYPVVLQEGGGKAEVDFGSSGRRHRHARSLLASLYGTINIPATAPYRCQFRLGDCPYTGPLVGIECFTPPPGSLSIRLFGPNGFPLEPNLCPSPEVCMYYNRVELQVRAPGSASGALVWAPLCAPLDLHLTGPVGDMVCWQVYNYLPGKVRPEFVVTSDPSITGFPLPNPTVAPGTVVQDRGCVTTARRMWLKLCGANSTLPESPPGPPSQGPITMTLRHVESKILIWRCLPPHVREVPCSPSPVSSVLGTNRL
ncbi:hypothetical protein VOLCADRAFT_87797 [Volvox carteri f. nagariensis]|uniref:Uncharacterized protein n=1 Tax=Volvox carteri f. nagariensis TaxID=3068 RepID=D8TM98_VOLCA|nr:uncharacterized protein VOLCADRAFT_87797 [Volvox carteri f. nagariensis]EFJ51604.1 hypothetical protein VOLCADRAFT_87797 [Volvox carteri f. nagariensis]|eukprot:XP_002947556.1 hypothetical protein VOLCADRAFT_87797 [Volvox carteri f. nagariensis]